jgi:UDP-N-acetylmuramate--alanine ligase
MEGSMNSAFSQISQLATFLQQQRRTCCLIGICGSGMRSMAQALLEAGHDVIGTDSCLTSAAAAEAEALSWSAIQPQIVADTNPQTIPAASIDMVIASVAIPPGDATLRQMQVSGIPCVTLPQAAAALWSGRQQICIAGTHGKTTTTGLLDSVLSGSGPAPGLFLGGQILGSDRCGRFGTADVAIIESCEYRRSFHWLNPTMVVLTGIDRDHFDSFECEAAEQDAFHQFLQQTPSGASVVVNADDRRAMECARSSGRTIVSYGHASGATFRFDAICSNTAGTTFQLQGPDGECVEFRSRLPGRHNTANITAAAVAAYVRGIDLQHAAARIAQFAGVRRRFEQRGHYRGAVLIDDYAHHPAAISATLSAARERFPGRRILAVFEPHQSSRLRALGDQFLDALLLADLSLVLPVLPVREQLSATACIRMSGNLVRQLNSRGQRAFLMANLDQATHKLDDAARDGDVIITMGAGRTNQIHDELNRRLQRDYAA